VRRTLLGSVVVLVLVLSGAVPTFAQVPTSAAHRAPAPLLGAGILGILAVGGVVGSRFVRRK
jgi:hypothetical protein